jgi:histidine triad (HIT) family protein
MSAVYDANNIFARILRGEIPCNKVAENDQTLAFYDIQPQASVHIIVIPKGAYISAEDFSIKASSVEQGSFWALIGQIIQEKNLGHLNSFYSERGFRLIANAGKHGGQEVPHFHMHILGGEPLGAMLLK